jgi:cytochrome P450/NADPH-cytochrome P450 reductase
VFKGVCSNYLAVQPVDATVYGFVRKPTIPFRPPDSPHQPMIMVGPGTGVAPFRGFLQERAARKAKLSNGQQLGPALLFFGCRCSSQDYIYRDELADFEKQGVVTLYTAFSREPGQPKAYVQDVLKAHADEVYKLLQDGAVVYVCGDAGSMEPAVRATLEDIYAAKAGVSAEEAAKWQAGLVAQQRYLADVWARG